MPRVSRFKLPPLKLDGQTLGQRLQRLRKGQGYTQVELADKIGIVQNIISEYERGRLRPHAEMIVRLAQALEVTADQLLGLKPTRANGRAVTDRRFRRRLQKINALNKRDQGALLRTIDAFLSKAK